MSDAIFLLDTNVFIEAYQRYYGLDLCPGFWDALRHFCGGGRILSLDRVRNEISDREDELTTWAKDAPAELFAASTAAPVLAKYREIMTWVNAGPYKDAAKAEFADGADGWLIAYAQIESLVLVTHERFAPDVKRTVPMPNVCQQFAVSYAHTFDMLRDLEVSFEWTPRSLQRCTR